MTALITITEASQKVCHVALRSGSVEYCRAAGCMAWRSALTGIELHHFNEEGLPWGDTPTFAQVKDAEEKAKADGWRPQPGSQTVYGVALSWGRDDKDTGYCSEAGDSRR